MICLGSTALPLTRQPSTKTQKTYTMSHTCDEHHHRYGGYSITVSASVCGTDSSGSIPGSRPSKTKSQREALAFCFTS